MLHDSICREIDIQRLLRNSQSQRKGFKQVAYTAVEAQKFSDSISYANTVVLHVGINDLKVCSADDAFYEYEIAVNKLLKKTDYKHFFKLDASTLLPCGDRRTASLCKFTQTLPSLIKLELKLILILFTFKAVIANHIMRTVTTILVQYTTRGHQTGMIRIIQYTTRGHQTGMIRIIIVTITLSVRIQNFWQQI
jgi:hypothetical protein